MSKLGKDLIESATEALAIARGEASPARAENPEWTEADFRKARPASELPADILDAFPRTPRE